LINYIINGRDGWMGGWDMCVSERERRRQNNADEFGTVWCSLRRDERVEKAWGAWIDSMRWIYAMARWKRGTTEWRVLLGSGGAAWIMTDFPTGGRQAI
jgi:hypothetical protein